MSRAKLFVSAVDAANPAAGPAFAFEKFLAGAPHAAGAGINCPSVFDPADELVAGKGSDVFPKR